MPRTNPAPTPTRPLLRVRGVPVRLVNYITMETGVILVEVETLDGEPALRGSSTHPPYWVATNSLQINRNEIEVTY